MRTVTKLLSVIFIFGLMSGCASVMEGSDQVININTTGCEEFEPMRCNVVNSEGSSTLTAPSSVSVEKARGAMTISCTSRDRSSATGNLVVDSSYEAMNAGNILAGGIIGIGVDAATGAMWKYPSTVVVPMSCASGVMPSRSGYTTKRWPDGRQYQGAFANDLPNGQGVLNLPNGDEYRGNFVGGLYDGMGSYSWSSGQVYSGEFTRGILKGQGTIKFVNGDEYRGEVLDGKPHGRGTMKYWNNTVSEGVWLDGNLQTQ